MVIGGIFTELKKVMRKKTLPERLDSLIGLTYGLERYDCWVTDNEETGEDGDLNKAIKLLGSTWKRLLSHSNEELGIDAELTRGGMYIDNGYISIVI